MKTMAALGLAPRGVAAPPGGTDETNVSTEQPTTQTDAWLPGAHEQPRRTAGAQATAGQRPQAADRQHSAQATVLKRTLVDQRLPKSRRIRKRAEFVSMQRAGGRSAGSCFVVITVPARGSTSRIGITASRKVGGAVVRNRIKRLVREFFRRHRQQISPPSDVLVIARAGAAYASYDLVERELGKALRIDVSS
jgi:ribonuclease P protein component